MKKFSIFFDIIASILLLFASFFWFKFLFTATLNLLPNEPTKLPLILAIIFTIFNVGTIVDFFFIRSVAARFHKVGAERVNTTTKVVVFSLSVSLLYPVTWATVFISNLF